MGRMNKAWDSVAHAAFQTAGTLDTQRLTTEGLEAVNALPLLHFALGGTPREASVNGWEDYKLQCFERNRKRLIEKSSLATKTLKRPSDRVSPDLHPQRKKPTVRALKQQVVDQWFKDFI